MSKPTPLYDKIWNDHLVHEAEDGTCLLYIDRHLVHEVTSPQAFEGLRATGRKVHAPEKTLAVVDHNVPTTDRSKPNPDPESIEQIRALAQNAKEFGVEYYDEFDKRQGIVHVIGPEQGFTLPGTTIVCGDSHTSTHGAFGALAHGIGTSEVEHVLATQTLIQKKAKNMRAIVDGKLPEGVTGKDIILAIIGEIGTAGGTGHVIEYAGEAVRSLSMEGRMTVCNMSIEGGARAGMVAPDEKTYAYLKDRPKSPTGEAWKAAVRSWDTLRSDEGAFFDREIRLDGANLPPIVTWGTSPEDVISVEGVVRDETGLVVGSRDGAVFACEASHRDAARRELGLAGRADQLPGKARPPVLRGLPGVVEGGVRDQRPRRVPLQQHGAAIGVQDATPVRRHAQGQFRLGRRFRQRLNHGFLPHSATTNYVSPPNQLAADGARRSGRRDPIASRIEKPDAARREAQMDALAFRHARIGRNPDHHRHPVGDRHRQERIGADRLDQLEDVDEGLRGVGHRLGDFGRHGRAADAGVGGGAVDDLA